MTFICGIGDNRYCPPERPCNAAFGSFEELMEHIKAEHHKTLNVYGAQRQK